MEKKIKKLLQSRGATLTGFAQTTGLKTHGEIELLPYAISFGIKLSSAVLKTITNRPSLLYKHHYSTINHYLDQTALVLTRYLEDSGYQALPIPASQIVDWEKRLGHLSHRELARRAGLGWIGRSGLLVNPQYGSQVRFASVLTDLAFPTGKELPFGCGDCYDCMTACPGQAISKDGVDAQKCYQKLREFSKIRGIGQYICGVCVKVCTGTRVRS